MVTKVFINIHEDFLEDFISAMLSENREEEFIQACEHVFSIEFPGDVDRYEAEAEVEELMFHLGFMKDKHYTLMDEYEALWDAHRAGRITKAVLDFELEGMLLSK